MGTMVMLDTMICIWAFKNEATVGQEGKIKQAQAFISSLDEEGVEIGISAVTLAELMVALSDEKRLAFVQSMQSAVCVYAFDARAAIEAARLFKSRLEGRGRLDGARQVVKADCQIAGTAISSGASVLYTEDDQLLKLSGSHIPTKPMPPIGQQDLEL